MKRKTLAKLAIDMIMTALFIALLFAFQTGLTFHEIAGVGVCVLMLTHLMLNRNWIARVWPRLGDTKPKTKFQFAIDMLLIVGVAGMLLTGLLISEVIIPGLDLASRGLFVKLHSWFSYGSGALIAIHILHHIPYLRSVCKHIKVTFPSREFKQVTAATVVACLVVGVLYSRAAPFLDNLSVQTAMAEMTTSSTGTSTDGSADGSGDKYPVSTNDAPDAVRPEKPGSSSTDPPGDKTESATDSSQTTVQGSMSADESKYLGGMTCTLCHKGCSLLAPQCGRGETLAQEVLTTYRASAQ